MTRNDEQLRDVLAKLSQTLSTLSESLSTNGKYAGEGTGDDDPSERVCTPKALPVSLQVEAARTAVRQNPVNAPALNVMRGLDDGLVTEPMRLAVMTQKYWGPQERKLTVSFMETTPVDLRDKIISHLNAWNKTAGISFAFTRGTGNVRISRGRGGYYSYLGTDILHIAPNRQTMNLEGFTVNTSDKEYRRVVRHEAGHTLGFPHEHMRSELISRLDPQKVYAYYLRTYGWSKSMVDTQVLTPLERMSIFGTTTDQTSIMCYQMPGSLTKDGKPILGGDDINENDYWFAGRIYPKAGQQPAMTAPEHRTSETEGPEQEEADESDFLRTPLEL